MSNISRPESYKTRKRVGRGGSSGLGKTSGRGQKGQFSRSGAPHRAWFEGGQMPIQRRVPKRGFNNSNFRQEYQIVKLSSIAKMTETDITPELLQAKGLVDCAESAIKILANGDIAAAKNVTADLFSAAAKVKIEKAGGKAIERK